MVSLTISKATVVHIYGDSPSLPSVVLEASKTLNDKTLECLLWSSTFKLCN